MKILVTGAGGLLGSAMVREGLARGHEVVAAFRSLDSSFPGPDASAEAARLSEHGGLTRVALDVTEEGAVRGVFREIGADAVVHCAGYTDVDGAETNPGEAMKLNARGASHVARAAEGSDSLLVYPSTDYVFDGTATVPYPPDHPPNPINVYGRSKLKGEEAVRAAGGRWLVVRTSWLYGSGGADFIDAVLDAAVSGDVVPVVSDQRGRPTWTGSLAPALLDLLEDSGSAVGSTLHLADRDDATWYDLAAEAFALSGPDATLVPVTSEEWAAPAPRPRYSVLDLEAAEEVLGRRMPSWRESLRSYLCPAEESKS